MRNFWLKSGLVSAGLIIGLIGLELGLRTFEQYLFHIPFNFSVAAYEDRVLGWRGKQVFGDVQTQKFKIFILGDSFTEAGLLSENEIYYQILKDQPNLELFVYASAGYGTLQEYLALDRYVDEIRPDLVILQVTGNDIVNNSLALESNSFANNNLYLRPYLIDNQIQLKFPSRLGIIRFELTKHSRLGYRVFAAGDKILAGLAKQEFLKTIEAPEQQLKYAEKYAEAEKTTQTILTKMRQRIGQAKFVLFPVTLNYPEFNQMIKSEIADENWLDAPAKQIEKLKTEGYDLHEPDRQHWNAAGHKIAGEILLQELVRGGFIPLAKEPDGVPTNTSI